MKKVFCFIGLHSWGDTHIDEIYDTMQKNCKHCPVSLYGDSHDKIWYTKIWRFNNWLWRMYVDLL
jgi:hypothetical protein